MASICADASHETPSGDPNGRADPGPVGVPTGELVLSGRSACVDRARLPARGDLAHIRLAGRCFVPHYAVPLTYRTVQATQLRPLPRAGAEALAVVQSDIGFDVLDIAGGWAWGQVATRDHDGLVGYLPMTDLKPE